MTHPDSFRIAMLGCGRISRNHWEAVARVDGLSIAAVCDVDAERARAAGEELHVPWFKSYEEMLSQAPCEIVTIATPSGLHPAAGDSGRAGRQARHRGEADGDHAVRRR